MILGGVQSSTRLDMAVTPAVFFKFGQRAAEHYLARESGNPLDAIPAVATTATVPADSS